MAHPKRHRGPRQPRHHGRQTLRETDAVENQPLFRDLRRALRSDEPVDLLALVSAMVEAVDRRDSSSDGSGTDLATLVESFSQIETPETTAALQVMNVLLGENPAVTSELAARHHMLPGWLAQLEDAGIDPVVWRMSHALGDGDNYMLGVNLADQGSVSVVIYVDHNMGSIVKDVFVAPGGTEDLVIHFGQLMDQDTLLERVDPAQARVMIEEAVERWALMDEPHETDTWPACRAVMMWALRMLPEGGEPPHHEQWRESDLGTVARDFFASDFGKELDSDDNRVLLDVLLGCAMRFGSGDPLRWSPVVVELAMMDWIPERTTIPWSIGQGLPRLLAGFIGYCHHERGISAGLTEETVGAISAWADGYAEAMERDGSRFSSPEEVVRAMLQDIVEAIGGAEALENLDDNPLPDEEFDWEGIDETIRPTLEQVVDLCDLYAVENFSVEYRTVLRRLIRRTAIAEPLVIVRRGAAANRTAASFAWIALQVNGTESEHIAVQDLQRWFGVKGNVSQRAHALLAALDDGDAQDALPRRLADPGLMTSASRTALMRLRDYLAAGS